MRIILSLLVCLLVACTGNNNGDRSLSVRDSSELKTEPIENIDSINSAKLSVMPEKVDTTDLERAILKQGLVDIQQLSNEVVVDMKYSTEDNFLNEDVYEDYDKCYLLADVAKRLVQAQDIIMDKHPQLRLLLFDCVRPRSVQYKMWEIVKGTDQQKYVAPPGGTGSMHNYGAAVDLGLTHLDTGIVDMGTPFDFFGELAQPRYEVGFVKSGKLDAVHLSNRRILRAAMLESGFHGILSEWWHFNGFPRKEVKKKYQPVE